MTMQCVLDGGRYFEGPRWHAGRLWFVDCMDRTLFSLSPSGEREQHAKFDGDTPCGTGILPDGRLVVLTMYRKRLLTYADGRLSLYADLSGIAAGTIDDMIIDGQGRAYVGDLGFDMPPPPDRGAPGRIILVMPDGETRWSLKDCGSQTASRSRPITAGSSSPKWMAHASPTMTSSRTVI